MEKVQLKDLIMFYRERARITTQQFIEVKSECRARVANLNEFLFAQDMRDYYSHEIGWT